MGQHSRDMRSHSSKGQKRHGVVDTGDSRLPPWQPCMRKGAARATVCERVLACCTPRDGHPTQAGTMSAEQLHCTCRPQGRHNSEEHERRQAGRSCTHQRPVSPRTAADRCRPAAVAPLQSGCCSGTAGRRKRLGCSLNLCRLPPTPAMTGCRCACLQSLVAPSRPAGGKPCVISA